MGEEVDGLVHQVDAQLRVLDGDVHVHAARQQALRDQAQVLGDLRVAGGGGVLLVLPAPERMGGGGDERAVEAADDANDEFVSLLSQADQAEISSLIEPSTEPAPQPTKLRIFVRLWEDDRAEHGVEIAGGQQVLPDVRFLSSDASTGIWHSSSDVIVDETSIGKIRTRRLPDGRIELGFVNTGGEVTLPKIRYIPNGISEGTWIRTSEIEIPLEIPLE